MPGIPGRCSRRATCMIIRPLLKMESCSMVQPAMAKVARGWTLRSSSLSPSAGAFRSQLGSFPNVVAFGTIDRLSHSPMPDLCDLPQYRTSSPCGRNDGIGKSNVCHCDAASPAYLRLPHSLDIDRKIDDRKMKTIADASMPLPESSVIHFPVPSILAAPAFKWSPASLHASACVIPHCE
jgi:hypothetical protein